MASTELAPLHLTGLVNQRTGRATFSSVQVPPTQVLEEIAPWNEPPSPIPPSPNHNLDVDRNTSPKTGPPVVINTAPSIQSPSWEPPESWLIEEVGVEEEYTSSDEDEESRRHLPIQSRSRDDSWILVKEQEADVEEYTPSDEDEESPCHLPVQLHSRDDNWVLVKEQEADGEEESRAAFLSVQVPPTQVPEEIVPWNEPPSPIPPSPNWEPPECRLWIREADVEEEYTSSDENEESPRHRPIQSRSRDDPDDANIGGSTHNNPSTQSIASVPSNSALAPISHFEDPFATTNSLNGIFPKRKAKRCVVRPPASQRVDLAQRKYTIRIYRANNTYHVVSIGFRVTVASLTPKLKNRLLMGEDRETHRLYVEENGRERILAPTERLADIVRRQLEQAGYDISEGLGSLGPEVLLPLFKFVYKSQPAEEDTKVSDYQQVDLSDRSLRTIPVSSHARAWL